MIGDDSDCVDIIQDSGCADFVGDLLPGDA